MARLKQLGALAAGATMMGAAFLAPAPAKAWVRVGFGIWVPPVVVAPAPIYVPPPAVVYAPPPPPRVVYAPRQPYWVPGHWARGYWVPGHWA
ncbi:MAG: hypothetical protein JO122_11525 [Acetobacteraceae bacterium]|nr:hypothetical protein [Acetobacteraceae bacterium]